MFEQLFKTEIGEMNLCTASEHIIETRDTRTIYKANHWIPVHYESQIYKEIKKNLRLGIIQESKSPCSSPIVPVTKKDDTREFA